MHEGGEKRTSEDGRNPEPPREPHPPASLHFSPNALLLPRHRCLPNACLQILLILQRGQPRVFPTLLLLPDEMARLIKVAFRPLCLQIERLHFIPGLIEILLHPLLLPGKLLGHPSDIVIFLIVISPFQVSSRRGPRNIFIPLVPLNLPR